MKTRTYARLALLIPLLVWLIFLLVALLINAVIPADLSSGEPITLLRFLEVVVMFYLIGILLWFLPYLVLSITLLLLSFKLRLETLQYLFMLSPFAMAILTMIEATILTLAGGGYAMSSFDLPSSFNMGIGINVMMGILSLVYGYICVGLGIAGYKLLQRLGKIKEEEKENREMLNANSQEA